MGDELAAIDPAPGEAHNYFAVLEYEPTNLLTKLVKHHGYTQTAFKVASLMGENLVQAVLSSCLPSQDTMQAGTQSEAMQSTALLTEARAGEQGEHASGEPGAQALASSSEPAEGGEKAGSDQQGCEKGEVRSMVQEETASAMLSELQPLSEAVLRYWAERSRASQASQEPRARKQGSAKPYGTDLDTEEISQVMASRKARLPGIPSAEEAPEGLTVALLEKTAAVSPLPAFVAAVIALFHRHRSLDKGPIPLIPPQESSHQVISLPSGLAKGKGGQVPHVDGASSPSDEELLGFASQIAKQKFPILSRWLDQQVAAVDGLLGLTLGASPV